MDLAGIQRLTCSLPAVSRLHSLTHNSIPNHTAIIFSPEGLVRLGPAEDRARQRQHSHAGRSRSSLDHVTWTGWEAASIVTVRASAVSAHGAAPEADAPYALSGYGLAKSHNVPNLRPCEQGPSPIRPGGESRACRI